MRSEEEIIIELSVHLPEDTAANLQKKCFRKLIIFSNFNCLFVKLSVDPDVDVLQAFSFEISSQVLFVNLIFNFNIYTKTSKLMCVSQNDI